MGNYIEVDIETLKRDYENMEQILRLVRNDMDMVLEDVQELGTMWKGAAHDAFFEQVNIDNGILQDVAAEVDGVIDSMENAARLYQACEEEIDASIDAIKIK